MENLNNMMMGIKKSVDTVARSMESLKNQNKKEKDKNKGRGSITSNHGKRNSIINRLADTPVNIPSQIPAPLPNR